MGNSFAADRQHVNPEIDLDPASYFSVDFLFRLFLLYGLFSPHKNGPTFGICFMAVAATDEFWHSATNWPVWHYNFRARFLPGMNHSRKNIEIPFFKLKFNLGSNDIQVVNVTLNWWNASEIVANQCFVFPGACYRVCLEYLSFKRNRLSWLIRLLS